MQHQFEFLSYDVWGNARDGYEVNDTFSTGQFTSFPDDADDKLIIHAVKNRGYAPKNARYASFTVSGDDMLLGVEYHGRPICGLCRVEWGNNNVSCD